MKCSPDAKAHGQHAARDQGKRPSAIRIRYPADSGRIEVTARKAHLGSHIRQHRAERVRGGQMR